LGRDPTHSKDYDGSQYAEHRDDDQKFKEREALSSLKKMAVKSQLLRGVNPKSFKSWHLSIVFRSLIQLGHCRKGFPRIIRDGKFQA
jgi:hypothetical protein